MAFKLKDLIINVVPQAGGEECPTVTRVDARAGCRLPSHVVYCPPPSAPVLLLPAGVQTQVCPTFSAFGDAAEAACADSEPVCPTFSAGTGSMTQEGLAALKQQLQQALAQVEEQERTLEASQLPQTLAEAEDLEARLRGALEELQRHKEGLKG